MHRSLYDMHVSRDLCVSMYFSDPKIVTYCTFNSCVENRPNRTAYIRLTSLLLLVVPYPQVRIVGIRPALLHHRASESEGLIDCGLIHIYRLSAEVLRLSQRSEGRSARERGQLSHENKREPCRIWIRLAGRIARQIKRHVRENNLTVVDRMLLLQAS